ncbi:MAG TPA: geranylgeranyl reductase family protein [Gaiellaceae bacterium]|nr:geranylgeranyl reductase family protein [Gaiellaceae bacterium]
MERFDAIVVGAGPAGSTAAVRLSRAGARVLLLDRERFPRDKPCGGGLTYRAVRQLPMPVDAVVEDVVYRVELGFGYSRRFERSSDGPLILMTQRRRLDAYLAERAADAGADFRDGVRARGLELERGGATVRFDGSAAAAPVVIGADGVNGLTVRALGLLETRRHGVALEGNASYEDESRFRGRALVDLGAVPGGYAWAFPKGDHVNVGVGGWEREGPRLREHLARACAGYAVPPERLRNLRGYRLPMRGPGERPVRGRVLAVGDAAGLIDPLSGDGIYEALVSARLAAEAALDVLAGRSADVEPYAERLAEELDPLTSAGWGAKAAFDRHPRLAYALTRTPPAWRLAERMLRGELSSPRVATGVLRLPAKALKALAA